MTKKLTIALLAVLPFFAEAQSFYAIKRPRNLTVYGGTGTAAYFGELVNPKSIGKIRYNLVVGSELFLTPRITVRGEAVWFRVAGSDKGANDDRVERNLSFFSNCQELSVGGAFYFLPESKAFYQRKLFNVYAYASIGMLHFNPKAEYQGKNYALQPLQTENEHYSRFGLVVPYGLGIRVQATPLINIMVEGGYRTTFTDHLDDISRHRYVDPTLLKSDLSRALADRRRERDPDYPVTLGVRGNPKQNDGYFLMNVKFQYYLPQELFSKATYNKAYRQKRKVFNPEHNRRRR